MTGRNLLIALSVKCNDNWDEMYRIIKNKEKLSEEEVNELVKKAKPVKYTILDPKYPKKYKMQYKPPFVVYK